MRAVSEVTDDAAGAGAFDVVIIGSGVAGLVAALTAAETARPASPRLALLCSGELGGGCTRWAQGGIAAALGADDDPARHAADTVAAARGLADPGAVRVLCEDGPRCVQGLAAWGVPFDRDAAGELRLGQEAAHSRPRIVHAGGDATGRAISDALARRVRAAGVVVLDHHVALSLLRDATGACAGVIALDLANGTLRTLEAPSTILAAGGAGRLWKRSTNPPGATGAGVALAYAAGAEVESMEMMQFHPTALAVDGAPAFLISEAVRGEGAHVVDEHGERFLFASDPRGELAGRDTVAAAIWRHLYAGPEATVRLDCRHLGEQVHTRFPTVSGTLRELGLDLARDLVPIAPAAHYSIGGVRTDLFGATSVPGLFAAGEVASTGVHGANRLASNSLLEGAVFGSRAARAALRHAAEAPRPRHAEAVEDGLPGAGTAPAEADPTADALEARLREGMSAGAGLLRGGAGLNAAGATAAEVAGAAAALPFPFSATLRASARAASLMCEAALLREESRGAHQRTDAPQTDIHQTETWVLHIDRGPRRDSHARPDR